VPDKARLALLRIFEAAVAAVAGDAATRRWLTANVPGDEIAVVAVGKAAGAMYRGAREALGPRIGEALVITGRAYLDREPADAAWVEGAHPVPDGRSLAAGETLLAFIGRQPMRRHLLFLVSGGASSMVEVLRPGLDQSFLAQVNQWLLGSGLAIDRMNTVRKAMSALKGGGLAALTAGRPVTGLLISDVPGDDPGVIGSGLLVPDPTLRERLAGLQLPSWISERLSIDPRAHPAASPRQIIVACNRDAREAAAAEARRLGYEVFMGGESLSGDAVSTGRRLAADLLGTPPGIHIFGGETVVRLPEAPGRGGRNQHLALAAASVLDGQAGAALLSAGTDGRDGPGEDAGALVDGGTLSRGRLAGLDLERALLTADSGSFLEAAGDLVHAGATGTNVMDLVLGWRST